MWQWIWLGTPKVKGSNPEEMNFVLLVFSLIRIDFTLLHVIIFRPLGLCLFSGQEETEQPQWSIG